MLSPEVLSICLGALDTEAEFLRAVDRRGVSTVRQAAAVHQAKAAIADELEALAKAAAAAAKEKKA